MLIYCQFSNQNLLELLVNLNQICLLQCDAPPPPSNRFLDCSVVTRDHKTNESTEKCNLTSNWKIVVENSQLWYYFWFFRSLKSLFIMANLVCVYTAFYWGDSWWLISSDWWSFSIIKYAFIFLHFSTKL